MSIKTTPRLAPHITPANDKLMIHKGWWYEDEGGIYVLCNGESNDGTLTEQTPQVRIQWRHLLKAAKRCGRIR